MIDRKALLKQYSALVDDEGAFIKALDQLFHAQRSFEGLVTDFLTPEITFVIEQIAQRDTDLKILKSGVFENAERVKLFIIPEYSDEIHTDTYMTLLEINYNQKFNQLEHRDALGALMALGIKRSKLGDIVVFEGGFQVVVDKSLGSYFAGSVDKIGRAGVTVKMLNFEDAKIKSQNTRSVSGTVKSIRLDSIIALCYSISRNECQKLIESGLVKVNHIATDRSDYGLKIKDLISVRGYGRFVVEDILGVTKKDRIRVLLSVVTR